jgi:hypothetical protein
VAAFRAASGGRRRHAGAERAERSRRHGDLEQPDRPRWTAATDNVGVTGYRVERCAGAGCTNFAQIATPTATSYSDTGLTASTSYSYRVRAGRTPRQPRRLLEHAATTRPERAGGTPAPIAFVQARYAVPQTPQTSVTLAYSGAQTAGKLNVVRDRLERFAPRRCRA